MYSTSISYFCIAAHLCRFIVKAADVTNADIYPVNWTNFDFDLNSTQINDIHNSVLDNMYFRYSGSSGVPAMHAALLPPDGNVVFLDKIETSTLIKLANGRFAFSSLYNPSSKTVKPISVTTNPFCCGGSFLADGTLVTVGGNGPLPWVDDSILNGLDAIRWFKLGGDEKQKDDLS